VSALHERHLNKFRKKRGAHSALLIEPQDRLVCVKRVSILARVLLTVAISTCGGRPPPPEKQAITLATPVAGPVTETDEPQKATCPPGSTRKEDSCVPCEGAPEMGVSAADQRAACAYAEISNKIPPRMELERTIEGYQGGVSEIAAQFQQEFDETSAFAKQLEPLAAERDAKHWAIMARLRQGALFEVLQIRLEQALPPKVNLYSAKEEDLLKKAESSKDASLLVMAAQIRSRREETYQQTRERWLQSVETPMVRSYAEALFWAKTWKIKNQAIDRGKNRFHAIVEKLGEQKTKEYTDGLVDPDTKKPFLYSADFFFSP
jgi:hypothetical protein